MSDSRHILRPSNISTETFFTNLVFTNPFTRRSTAPISCLVDTGAIGVFISYSDMSDDLGMQFNCQNENDDSDVGSTQIGNGVRTYTPVHLLRVGIADAPQIRAPCLNVGFTHGSISIVGMKWLKAMKAIIDTTSCFVEVTISTLVSKEDQMKDLVAYQTWLQNHKNKLISLEEMKHHITKLLALNKLDASSHMLMRHTSEIPEDLETVLASMDAQTFAQIAKLLELPKASSGVGSQL